VVEVWITFACEDFVNPETDEVYRRLAQTLVANDLVAEFFISGTKALATHQHRPDVVEYLKATGMVIGYQGNGHSIHPVIVEYSHDKGWEEGVEEARRRETQYLQLSGRLDPVLGILGHHALDGERAPHVGRHGDDELGGVH